MMDDQSERVVATKLWRYVSWSSPTGLLIVAVVLAVFLAMGRGYPSVGSFKTRDPFTTIVAVNKPPLVLLGNRALSIRRSSSTSAAGTKLAPSQADEISVSYAVHLLRLHGRGALLESASVPNTEILLTALTDDQAGKRLFGKSMLRKTFEGVRYLEQPKMRGRAAESHRDICLATFAELGLPLSFPIRLEHEAYSIHDLLEDSVLSFHTGQRELEWTAVAYALYLPPIAKWMNRYGEWYTFDDLAATLLQRQLGESPCGGVHVLMALTVMVRIDDSCRILSRSMRRRTEKYLHQRLSVALATQQEDGSWSRDWFTRSKSTQSDSTESSTPTTAINSVLLTGHLVEWIDMLPESFGVPVHTTHAACHWLERRVIAATQADMQEHFCAYSHALTAIHGRGNYARR